MPLKGVPGALVSWLVTENPSREVATKDHFTSDPRKGNPPDLRTKADVGKVDVKPVKGFPTELPPQWSSTAKLRIWTLRIWGFRGPGFRSARQVLCGDASRLFLDHFPKHPSSVLGRTELCHEVRNPGPQKPRIIRNENHHLALFGTVGSVVWQGVGAYEVSKA